VVTCDNNLSAVAGITCCFAVRQFFVSLALHKRYGESPKCSAPLVRLLSSLDRKPVSIATSYSISRSLADIPNLSGAPPKKDLSQGHSRGRSIRRFSLLSDSTPGFLMDTKASRTSLRCSANQRVNAVARPNERRSFLLNFFCLAAFSRIYSHP